MKSDLISRSTAKDEILSWAVSIQNPRLLSKDDTMFVLDKLPAVDAVEVVRCKDCKCYIYSEEDGCFSCDALGGLHEPDAHDFCSYGEKRDAEQTLDWRKYCE